MIFTNILNRIAKNNLLRNFSVLVAGEVISRAINMLINIILAKALAPAFYGEYSLLITYISLIYVVSSLGLQPIVIRSIARNQNNSKQYFYLSLKLRLLGYIFAVVAFFIYNLISPIGFSNYLITALLVGVFLNSFWDAFQNVAFGMERMEWTSIINVSISAISFLAYMVLPKNLFTVEIVISIYIISFVVRDLFYLISLYKGHLITSNTITDNSNKYGIKNLLIDSSPYYILAIFTLFSTQFPILFLKNNCGNEEVAFFYTANKLLIPVSLLITTALNALFPNQSKLFINDKSAFVGQIRVVLIFISVVGIFSASIITLFRNELVFLLYGNAYKSTGDVLAFQSWFFVLYSIFCFIGGTYGAANKQKLVAITSIVYALISVPILWYSSYYGARGLAIGFIIASIINMTYCYYYLMKIISFKISNSFTIKFFSVFILAFSLIEIVPPTISVLYKILILLFMVLIGAFNYNRIKSLIIK